MKAGQIALQLAETNRWWRDPAGWATSDPTLRAAVRTGLDYRARVLDDIEPGGLYVLRGPRRVGKSTEIKYAIADLLASGVPARAIIHASVDGWRASDLRTMVTAAAQTFLAGAQGTRYWFLDEVTSVPDGWPQAVTYLRDTDPQFADDTVVLTGSSAQGLAEVRKALAGRRGPARSADRTLLPMRFADLARSNGLALPTAAPVAIGDLTAPTTRDLVDELAPYLADLVRLWESYLRIGGFPQAVASWLAAGDVTPAFTDALWDIVHGDAFAKDRFTATQSGQLLGRLAGSLSATVNVSALARDLDVGREALTGRLADLAEHFLTWPCHREQGLRVRPAAQSKWYFVDPLLARLAATRRYGTDPDHAVLSEQQVGVSLLRALDAATSTGSGADVGYGSVTDADQVLHYRSSTSAEIDFVGRAFGGVAIESKYVDGGWRRAAATLRASPWRGVMATRSVLEWEGDVVALPAPILVLLLEGVS